MGPAPTASQARSQQTFEPDKSPKIRTLSQFWRIGVRWLRVRRARALDTLEELRRTVSRVDLAGLCHAVSRHARLDELGIQIGREAGALARVVSRHARIDEAGEAGLTLLGSIGRRVASVPARLSELITPPGAPPSCASSRTPQPPHDDLRAAQRARFGGDARARVREWCWLDIYDNPPHTPSASSPAPRAPAPDKGGAERRGDGHGVGPKELALLDGAARADGGDDRATMRSTPRTRRRAC